MVPTLSPDRLFPADPSVRNIARRLHGEIEHLPIISPHGHTDAGWFARNDCFSDPASLFIKPDHYVFRMLYSQGISLESLGLGETDVDPRDVWRIFAENYHLFRGTPTRMWFDWVFSQVFGLNERFSAGNAGQFYDIINAALATDMFRPRALFERFNIELLATTESPLDSLADHIALQASGWSGRVITTYRPDPVVDPEFEGFATNLDRFGRLTGEDVLTWQGYLRAHRKRREFFKTLGATATDHGHPTAATTNLSAADAEALFNRIVRSTVNVAHGTANSADAELFRGQMLTEMAAMSLEDGLVMQIHPGSSRNHNRKLFEKYGRDKGADIPMRTDYVTALKPLLDRFGNEPSLSIILFTLDESSYARELAPLAGHYPCLKLGPAWWFHDAPEGMMRFREMTTETAGFYNLVGFNDDTRAFLSIPARHDVARRVDCAYLARLVAEHRLREDEAAEIAVGLAYGFAKAAYRL